MERMDSVIRNALEDLCTIMDLGSYTIHKNKTGTTCTLRFKERSAILDPEILDTIQTESRTYVQKSKYHTNRDTSRARLHQYRYQPRTDLVTETIEKFRQCDNSEISDTTQSKQPVMEISPVCNLNIEATEFHMSEKCGDGHDDAYSSSESTHSLPRESTLESEPKDVTAPLEVDSSSVEIPEIQSPTRESSISTECTLPAAATCCPILDSQKTHDTTDSIELDYVLPKLIINNNQYDLLCDLCDALPPSGTRLNLCVNCNIFICGQCTLVPSNCEHSMGHNGKIICSMPQKPSPSDVPVYRTLKSREPVFDLI